MAQADHPPHHGRRHAHGRHGHGAGRAAAVPVFSLLRASILQRLTLAGGPVLALWALVWWAMR